MRVTSIEALWDIIWGLTDISPTLPRPPNTVIRKDRHSKTSIYTLIQNLTKNTIKMLETKFQVMVKKNFKNDMRLKCSQMHRFSIPNIKFFVGNVYDSEFNIFSKKCIP